MSPQLPFLLISIAFLALATLAPPQRVDAYLDIFCTKTREKTKERIATSAIEKTDPDLCTRLNEERDRVWGLVQRRRAIETRDRSSALFTIAYEVIVRFRAEKNRRGLLDYDDLLLYWFHAMNDPAVAADVRARFDAVLVDEYQDTNALQAAVLKNLCPTGQGLTVVGDDAQSIYAFRGADVYSYLDVTRAMRPCAPVATPTARRG